MASPYITIDQDAAIKGVLLRANADISPDLALSHWIRMDAEMSCRRINTALGDSHTWAYADFDRMVADIDASL